MHPDAKASRENVFMFSCMLHVYMFMNIYESCHILNVLKVKGGETKETWCSLSVDCLSV